MSVFKAWGVMCDDECGTFLTSPKSGSDPTPLIALMDAEGWTSARDRQGRPINRCPACANALRAERDDRPRRRGDVGLVDDRDQDAGADPEPVHSVTFVSDRDEAVARFRDLLDEGRDVVVVSKPDQVTSVLHMLGAHEGASRSSVGGTPKVGPSSDTSVPEDGPGGGAL